MATRKVKRRVRFHRMAPRGFVRRKPKPRKMRWDPRHLEAAAFFVEM